MAPPSNLVRALTEVRLRIQKAAAHSLNEQNTKASLIEPVLRALGWDPEDFEEVVREGRLKRQDKPVDYGLLIHREPRLLIEAKALGTGLEDRRSMNQVMGYAAVVGVQWVVLTDGNEYQIFNSAASVPVEQKLFRSFDLRDGGREVEDTLALLSKAQLIENRIDSLWKAVHVDRQVRSAIESLFDGGNELALVNLVLQRTKDLSPEEVRASLRRCRVHLDFPIDVEALGGPSRQRVTAPKAAAAKPEGVAGVTLGDLISRGLLQPPAELSATYKGKVLVCQVLGPDEVRFGREVFTSLSSAGGAAKASVSGPGKDGELPATNGWDFWKVQGPSRTSVPVGSLRERFLEPARGKGRRRRIGG